MSHRIGPNHQCHRSACAKIMFGFAWACRSTFSTSTSLIIISQSMVNNCRRSTEYYLYLNHCERDQRAGHRFLDAMEKGWWAQFCAQLSENGHLQHLGVICGSGGSISHHDLPRTLTVTIRSNTMLSSMMLLVAGACLVLILKCVQECRNRSRHRGESWPEGDDAHHNWCCPPILLEVVFIIVNYFPEFQHTHRLCLDSHITDTRRAAASTTAAAPRRRGLRRWRRDAHRSPPTTPVGGCHRRSPTMIRFCNKFIMVILKEVIRASMRCMRQRIAPIRQLQ